MCSEGTPVGIVNADTADLNQDQKNYIEAMNWLSGEDPEDPGKSRVDKYVEKQTAYTKTVEDKQAAFAKAMKDAQEDPRNTNIKMQREAYDQWVNAHARTYRNHMQAAYMDWVITGRKEAVEYYFAMVDLDTAMARVEQSKVEYTVPLQDLLLNVGTLHVHLRNACVLPPSWIQMAPLNIKRLSLTRLTGE